MAMVCPQCGGSFEQRLQCPVCAVRLVLEDDSRSKGGLFSGRWQQTPWGRILIGLLLAQGLYHGMRHLLTAGLLVAGDADVWRTLTGLLVLQGLQGLGLLAGGGLAGAGQRQGFFFGAVVGVWNGVLAMLTTPNAAPGLTALAFYGQPLLQTAFGAAGGFLGSLVFRPLPTVNVPQPGRAARDPKREAKRPSSFAGPIAWFRVAVGSAVAVTGAFWASVILETILEASGGNMTVSTQLQARLVTWEITAVAMLLGGGLAGATTFNGMKQGLVVGVAAAAMLVGIRLSGRTVAIDDVAVTTFSAIALGVLGGWFGSQLFPPVISAVRRRDTGPITY